MTGEVVHHFSPVNSAIIGWLNWAADAIGELALLVGDVEVLNSHHGHDSLVEGVQAALNRVTSTPELEDPIRGGLMKILPS